MPHNHEIDEQRSETTARDRGILTRALKAQALRELEDAPDEPRSVRTLRTGRSWPYERNKKLLGAPGIATRSVRTLLEDAPDE